MTHAIPFGIYLAPAEVIRADARDHINSDTQCYIQLVKRISSQSYAIYVAESYTDLQLIHQDFADEDTERRVIVSTISRQDLHTHCDLFAAPAAEKPLYAAPDCILKDKYLSDGRSLQLCASSAWITYLKVLHLFADGSVRVRVAALPHRLGGASRTTYVTVLNHSEFAMALQLERRDLSMETCDLREKVELHAKNILRRPVEHVHPQVLLDDQQEKEDHATQPKPAYPPEVLKMLHPVPVDLPISGLYDEEEMFPVAQRPATEKLEPVFIPNAIAKYAVERFKATTGKTPTSRKLEQKMWLQAALFALRSYKEQAPQNHVKEAINQQDQRIRAVLVNWINSSVLLVEAVPVVKKVGKNKIANGYIVRIEQPVVAA